MKVIGAGFGRTGTMSQKAALERLGFGPSFHMIDLIRTQDRLELWEAAAGGEQVDWHEVFDGWESTVDWPGCTFWEQIVETFPDAPVILSVREPDAWYRSCVDTIHAARAAAQSGQMEGGTEDPPPPEVMRFISGLIWERTFGGYERFLEDKQAAIDIFHRHNEAVKAGIDPDRLLVYDVKEGWEPLCEFLGVAVPDGPMPHLNDTASFRQMFGMPALAAT